MYSSSANQQLSIALPQCCLAPATKTTWKLWFLSSKQCNGITCRWGISGIIFHWVLVAVLPHHSLSPLSLSHSMPMYITVSVLYHSVSNSLHSLSFLICLSPTRYAYVLFVLSPAIFLYLSMYPSSLLLCLTAHFPHFLSLCCTPPYSFVSIHFHQGPRFSYQSPGAATILKCEVGLWSLLSRCVRC